MSPDALACPRCGTALTSFREPQGLTFACAECAGHAEGVSVLRKRLEADAVNDLWQRALSVRARKGLPCPSCRWPMAEVGFQAERVEAVVDACDRCLLVWFDAKERDALRTRSDVPGPLSPEAVEAVVRSESRRDVEVPKRGGEAETDQLPAWTAAPMDADEEVRPWATILVVAAVALAPFFGAFVPAGPAEGFVSRWTMWFRGAWEWGFVPADPWRHGGLTLLSSGLLTSGRLSHFVTVCLLLWVGWRVEARFGRLAVPGLFVLGSVAACLWHAAAHPGSLDPMIGSAGPVTALLAWCLVAYPGRGAPAPSTRRGRDPEARAAARRWTRLRETRIDIAWAAVGWAVVYGASLLFWFWPAVSWTPSGPMVQKGGFVGGALAGAGCGLVTLRLRRRAEAHV